MARAQSTQSNKALSLEERIALHKKEMERVKQNPMVRANLEESLEEAKRRHADPKYRPVTIKPGLEWEKAFKEEEENRKHSAY
jgi:hypothetical protein